jgi:hypothetical protein
MNDDGWKRGKTNHVTTTHIVGIIPVTNFNDQFGFEWDPCLMPIGPDYTLIEHACYTAACLGARTIWVVVDDWMQPLIRKRTGEFLRDPERDFWIKVKPEDYKSAYSTRHANQFKWRRIPIFYLRTQSKDRGKRDSYAFGPITAADIVDKVMSKTSNYVRPHKFLVTFPYGFIRPKQYVRYLRNEDGHSLRNLIASSERVLTRFNGETVRDNQFLPFTFTPDDWTILKTDVWKKGTGVRPKGTTPEELQGANQPLLPPEERWSARHFDLADVYSSLPEEGTVYYDLEEYMPISNWDEYRAFMQQYGNEWRPTNLMQRKAFRPIGEMFESKKKGE